MFPRLYYLVNPWSRLYRKEKVNICIFLSFTIFQDNKLASYYLPDSTSFFQCYELMDSNIFDRLQPVSNITLLKSKLSHLWPLGASPPLPLSHLDTTLAVLLASLLSQKTRYSRLNLCVSCLRPGMSHFSKKLGYFQWEMVFQNRNQGSKEAHCYSIGHCF